MAVLKIRIICLASLFFAVFFSMQLFSTTHAATKQAEIIIKPEEYPKAIRNPLKGFRTNYPHPFATLNKTYIQWSDLEDKESDGIDKIRHYCDELWKDYPERNMKAIPRVWLFLPSGLDKYGWPFDLENGDYSSDKFKARVVRFVKRLGEAWDNDPRVAYVEMGIIGYWGEHHQPNVSPEMQKILGDAFTAAFKNKLVMIRYPRDFKEYKFGIYWDSWAHYQQNDSLEVGGAGIAALGDRWKSAVIGGEAAYDWGNYRIQPGENPEDTLSDPEHLAFLLDSIRTLHCNHLGWVADYDLKNREAARGADEVQKAFGYRFVIDEVRYPAMVDQAGEFTISFLVHNTGSSPFYYRWPVEVSLLDPETRQPVWRETFRDADIRTWLPGDRWGVTDSEVVVRFGVKDAAGKEENLGTIIEHKAYLDPPRTNLVNERFKIPPSVKPGTYILALSILDPAGMLPSARFAIRNYFRGGRHPIGMFGVGKPVQKNELDPKLFYDVQNDTTLHYLVNGVK